MRVLVIGTGGALARGVATQLSEQGHEVTGMDRRPWFDAPRAIQVVTADIRKRAAEEVFRTERPEVVVHMATVNALSAGDEERARINVGGTKAVFENAIAHGVKHVLFVGRHTYYGAGPDSPLYHTEDEPPHGIGNFPQLADLVAADLFAANALWREPGLCTTVLRLCYTLGPSMQGTLATFLKGKRVPLVMGYDPLFQFLNESDAIDAIALAAQRRVKGIFNVAGPTPVPLSTIVRQTGRTPVPVPEGVLKRLFGRFGFPKLAPGALEHIKYPIVVDARAFARATGFEYRIDEVECLRRFAQCSAHLIG
jgi:UDP-glucose 4-epimerase